MESWREWVRKGSRWCSSVWCFREPGNRHGQLLHPLPVLFEPLIHQLFCGGKLVLRFFGSAQPLQNLSAQEMDLSAVGHDFYRLIHSFQCFSILLAPLVEFRQAEPGAGAVWVALEGFTKGSFRVPLPLLACVQQTQLIIVVRKVGIDSYVLQ